MVRGLWGALKGGGKVKMRTLFAGLTALLCLVCASCGRGTTPRRTVDDDVRNLYRTGRAEIAAGSAYPHESSHIDEARGKALGYLWRNLHNMREGGHDQIPALGRIASMVAIVAHLESELFADGKQDIASRELLRTAVSIMDAALEFTGDASPVSEKDKQTMSFANKCYGEALVKQIRLAAPRQRALLIEKNKDFLVTEEIEIESLRKRE